MKEMKKELDAFFVDLKEALIKARECQDNGNF